MLHAICTFCAFLYTFDCICHGWRSVSWPIGCWFLHALYILTVLFIYKLYPCIRPDSDSQSSLSHVSLCYMCPAWLGIRIMTYWWLFFTFVCIIYFEYAFISMHCILLMIRIPSHLCRMFLLLACVRHGWGSDAWPTLLAVFTFVMLYVLWLCFLFLYCTRPNDSDSQSSLAHVSLCSHVSGMVGGPNHVPLAAVFTFIYIWMCFYIYIIVSVLIFYCKALWGFVRRLINTTLLLLLLLLLM